VFKRPREDFYVGKAIESLGLKGYRIGGAQISEKHAGFIVNAGNATFDDVMKLIEFVRKKVKEKYGVELETEVEIWWNGRRW
jgi:UDP-N-acetylmuramate dehydrogenase